MLHSAARFVGKLPLRWQDRDIWCWPNRSNGTESFLEQRQQLLIGEWADVHWLRFAPQPLANLCQFTLRVGQGRVEIDGPCEIPFRIGEISQPLTDHAQIVVRRSIAHNFT